jgi:hypothetical protein
MINNKEINFLNTETPKREPTLDELKAQKLQLQIEEMKEKRQAKQTQQKSTLSKTINILFYMFLAPFLIIGFFAIECAKASAGSGRRRR